MSLNFMEFEIPLLKALVKLGGKARPAEEGKSKRIQVTRDGTVANQLVGADRLRSGST